MKQPGMPIQEQEIHVENTTKRKKMRTGYTIGAICVIGLSIGLGVGLTQCKPTADLSISATTYWQKKYNHGTLIDNEISFDSYENTQLYASVKYVPSNDTLQWKYSTNCTDWHLIASTIADTGIVATKSTTGALQLDASSPYFSYTYSDFYIEAFVSESNLTSKPIHVTFHTSPKIQELGGLINGTNTTITAFTPTIDLLNYDTIYIPSEITSITSGIFSDKFNGTDNYCQTIQNIIFADRSGTCDVGEDAFSSSTDLILNGNIYLGTGNILCNSTSGSSFFFSTHVNSISSSVIFNNVDIAATCTISARNYLYVFSGQCSTATGIGQTISLTVLGDVNITGELNTNNPYLSGYSSLVFSTTNWSGTAITQINGDINIDNILNTQVSNSYVFSADASISSVIIDKSINIRGNCSMSAQTLGVNFCSAYCFNSATAASLDIKDVTIAQTAIITMKANDPSKCFFYSYDNGGPGLDSFTFNGAKFYTSGSAQPMHINQNIPWPTWQYIT